VAIKELVELAMQIYQETKSGNIVAKRLHISGPTAYSLLREGGIILPSRFSKEVNDRKKKLQGDAALAAAADYQSGMGMIKLKKKYGVSAWAIKTAVRDNGIQERPRGGKTRKFSDGEISEICALYKAGMAQVHIAVKFKTHQISISRILKVSGVKTKAWPAKAESHGSWKGGKCINAQGYVLVTVDPKDPLSAMRYSAGYGLEHRLVMAKSIGRPLLGHESVHHINGIRTDNQLENLQLRTGKHGKGVIAKCAKCGCSDIVYDRIAH
jgi:hypothetical protein